jgi:hypothetical protein
MKLFRDLSVEEVVTFRAWARENYKPFETISGVWHPVIQSECAAMNLEASDKLVLTEMDDGAFAKLFG